MQEKAKTINLKAKAYWRKFYSCKLHSANDLIQLAPLFSSLGNQKNLLISFVFTYVHVNWNEWWVKLMLPRISYGKYIWCIWIHQTRRMSKNLRNYTYSHIIKRRNFILQHRYKCMKEEKKITDTFRRITGHVSIKHSNDIQQWIQIQTNLT